MCSIWNVLFLLHNVVDLQIFCGCAAGTKCKLRLELEKLFPSLASSLPFNLQICNTNSGNNEPHSTFLKSNYRLVFRAIMEIKIGCYISAQTVPSDVSLEKCHSVIRNYFKPATFQKKILIFIDRNAFFRLINDSEIRNLTFAIWKKW